jgi:hypothetical protein
MLPRDHSVSRFLNFTTAGVKCCVAAVKSCPVLHFSVVIFFWSFGIINSSTIKCLELSTAQASARGREGCCTYSLSLMYRLKQTICNSFVILLRLMLPRVHFVSRLCLSSCKVSRHCFFYSKNDRNQVW